MTDKWFPTKLARSTFASLGRIARGKAIIIIVLTHTVGRAKYLGKAESQHTGRVKRDTRKSQSYFAYVFHINYALWYASSSVTYTTKNIISSTIHELHGKNRKN